MLDKKFGRFVGIDFAHVREMTDEKIQKSYDNTKKEFLIKIKPFLDGAGNKYENMCAIVKRLENYEYDCRTAVFMLLGIRYADCHGSWIENRKNWPLGTTKDGRTTKWCNAFQKVIQLSDFSDTLNLDVSENGRLGRFGYQRLVNIEKKLENEIEKEKQREYKLETEVMETKNCDELHKEYESLLCATGNRKENWIFEDMVLGKSLSFTIYHRMRMIAQKGEVGFEIFIGLIEVLSSLKCFQLRNIIADEAFRIILCENDFSEAAINEVTENMKEMIGMVNRYYEKLLVLRWREATRNKELNDISYRRSFMNMEANSLGHYIEDGDSESYLVERSISAIGIYKAELEEDLKKLYSAEYDYMNDTDILAIEGLPILLLNGSGRLNEKREYIINEERKRIAQGEGKKKIVYSRKKVISDASALFTYIHWEVMKTYGK